MTVQEYTQNCIKFAEDSKEWGGIDPYKFYTTAHNGWEESSDNASGGIDVSWAFHMKPDEIKEQAAQQLLDNVLQIMRLMADDEWDSDSIYNWLECFQS